MSVLGTLGTVGLAASTGGLGLLLPGQPGGNAVASAVTGININPAVSHATPYTLATNSITGGTSPNYTTSGEASSDYGLGSVWNALQNEGQNIGSQGANMG